MRWFACFIPNLRNPSANATETYVLICLMIELAIGLAFLSPISQLSIVGWLFGVLAVLRIVEIMGRTIDVTDVIDPARTLVLGGINYVELSFCFGVIYALNYQSLQMASRPITAFYFSIITQLTIGYGDVSPKGWMRLVAATQGPHCAPVKSSTTTTRLLFVVRPWYFSSLKGGTLAKYSWSRI